MKKTLIIFFVLISCLAYSQDQNDMSLLQLGQQYENSGEIEQAEKIYSKLYEKNQNYYEFYNAYRRILEYSKKYKEANDVILKWLITRPGDLNQLTYLGINKMHLGLESEGWSNIQDAIKVSPLNINVYRSVAAELVEARYYDEALRIYLQGRSIDPNAFAVEMANIYIFREKYESAMQEYLKLLAVNSNQFGYVQSLMMAHIDNKTFLDAAVKLTKRSLDDNKNNLSFYYLLSWLYSEQKNYEDSFSLYLEIEKIRHTNGSELYNFAENAFRDKSFEIALKAYKYIIDNYKSSGYYMAARFGFAKTSEELSEQNYSAKISSFSKSSMLPATEVIPLYSGSIILYEEIIKDFPQSQFSAEALFRIGEIKYRKYNDLDGAIKSFVNVTKTYYNQPYAVNALLELGEIALLRNKIDEANQRYSEVLIHALAQPDQRDMAKFKTIEFLYFSARFDSASKILSEISQNAASDYTNDALLLLNFIQSNNKNQFLADYAKGEMYERQKKLSEALSIFKDLAGKEDKNSLVDESLLKCGLLQRQLMQYEDAVKSFNTLINKFPESSLVDQIIFLLGDIYETDLKDPKNALTAYERILVEFPNSMYINEARKRIRELKGDKNF
jgi:tetratricopeptide (TPR) repeat protein